MKYRLQLSNITYSENEGDTYQRSFGKNGFNKIFKHKIEKKENYVLIIILQSILDIENIESYSAKRTILTNMINNKTEVLYLFILILFSVYYH